MDLVLRFTLRKAFFNLYLLEDGNLMGLLVTLYYMYNHKEDGIHLAGEVDTIRSLLDLHRDWNFVWTPREGNEAAHLLAKWCARQHVAGVIRLEASSPACLFFPFVLLSQVPPHSCCPHLLTHSLSIHSLANPGAAHCPLSPAAVCSHRRQ